MFVCIFFSCYLNTVHHFQLFSLTVWILWNQSWNVLKELQKKMDTQFHQVEVRTPGSNTPKVTQSQDIETFRLAMQTL